MRPRRWAVVGLAALVGIAACTATAHAGELHLLGLQFNPEAGDERFSALVESWHEFYLMAGTAAVTLVGLLFVSLSMHLDVLLHHSRAHLLDLARQTLLAFVYVMLVALMVLVPPSTPRLLGATIGGSTLVVLAFSIAGLVNELRMKERTGVSRSLLRRRIMQILCLGLGAYSAAQLWQGSGLGLFMMIGTICAMLGNGAGSAWDLLVQVGRLKVKDRDILAEE